MSQTRAASESKTQNDIFLPAPQWVEEWVPEAPQAVADGLIRELESLENTGDSFVERLRMAVESESDSTVKDKLREIYEKVTT